MDQKQILEAIKAAREGAKQRKFSQSFDIIANLKYLNIKKPEEQVEFFLQLPSGKGKHNKICALVGGELLDEAKKVFDNAISQDDFEKYDKKAAKKLASEYDLFVAQGDIMALVAKHFGRVFGPRGRMPNPKAGCIIPPKGANLQAVYDKLKDTIKASAKKSLVMQVPVGNESMSDEDIAKNIERFYNQLIHVLPQHENNLKDMYLKLTMGKPIKLA